MTLAEKIAQLCCLNNEKGQLFDSEGNFLPDQAAAVMADGIGQVARPSQHADNLPGIKLGVTPGLGPAETAAIVNRIQRYAVEQTRLGIPIMFHGEGLHGYQARESTCFPQAIALASTWDPAIVEDVFYVVAREMRARGVTQALTPVLDVSRDPRWGRIEETYGEDPYLVSRIGVAAVKGFQGDQLPLASDRVFATLKHFAAHSEPTNGTNVGPGEFSERKIREVFLPPFEAAIREANAQSVMVTYNEIDGIPCAANTWLLRDLLRDEWKFDGFIVSDYWAIPELATTHHVVSDAAEAGVVALNAGIEVELPGRRSYQFLEKAVERGEVSEETLDAAVTSVLRAKFQAGLFEQPYAEDGLAEEITGNDDARDLALRAAHRSIILLKNESKLLPIDTQKYAKIAVIGPNAKEAVMGGYSDIPKQTVGILEGVEELVGDACEVSYAEGVRITENTNWWEDKIELADEQENLKRIKQAVAVAEDSELVVLVVGGNEQTAREAWSKTHMGDRDTLGLFGQQNELVEAILATGKPVVVVLSNGRPLAIPELAERAPAILECWYLGQETGTAVADVLFGKVNPGGKLPVSIPRSVGQLPIYYNYKPTARRGYLFSSTEPLYAFGHGLSYTSFRLSSPQLQEREVKCGDKFEVVATVENTGGVAGDEVVQLYIRDTVSTVTRPIKELKKFRRVSLEPGEKQEVIFELAPEDLAFYNREMEFVVEPGQFEIMVGPNSTDLKSATIRLTGSQHIVSK